MANYKDILPGGLADEYAPEDFDPKALEKGIEVELEHTDDPKLAREIAMDHLTEDPLYYEKLATIEENYLRSFISLLIKEYWSQHTEKYMEPEDIPFDNEEKDGDDRNPYKSANDSLNKVKAQAHPKSQRAGVMKGSGPPGAQRSPGGSRQGTSSGW